MVNIMVALEATLHIVLPNLQLPDVTARNRIRSRISTGQDRRLDPHPISRVDANSNRAWYHHHVPSSARCRLPSGIKDLSQHIPATSYTSMRSHPAVSRLPPQTDDQTPI